MKYFRVLLVIIAIIIALIIIEKYETNTGTDIITTNTDSMIAESLPGGEK